MQRCKADWQLRPQKWAATRDAYLASESLTHLHWLPGELLSGSEYYLCVWSPNCFFRYEISDFFCVCMWGGGSVPPEPPRSVMFHVLSTSYNSLLSHKSISSQHIQAKNPVWKPVTIQFLPLFHLPHPLMPLRTLKSDMFCVLKLTLYVFSKNY